MTQTLEPLQNFFDCELVLGIGISTHSLTSRLYSVQQNDFFFFFFF